MHTIFIVNLVLALHLLCFEIKLISLTVEKYRSDAESSPRGSRPSLQDNPFRSVKKHFSSNVPATVACKKRITHRETRYQCAKCDARLCAVPCFKKYHKLKNFQEASEDFYIFFILFCFFKTYIIYFVYSYDTQFVSCVLYSIHTFTAITLCQNCQAFFSFQIIQIVVIVFPYS